METECDFLLSKLVLYPEEIIYNKENGINLLIKTGQNDNKFDFSQGNLIFTNKRIIWFKDQNTGFFVIYKNIITYGVEKNKSALFFLLNNGNPEQQEEEYDEENEEENEGIEGNPFEIELNSLLKKKEFEEWFEIDENCELFLEYFVIDKVTKSYERLVEFYDKEYNDEENKADANDFFGLITANDIDEKCELSSSFITVSKFSKEDEEEDENEEDYEEENEEKEQKEKDIVIEENENFNEKNNNIYQKKANNNEMDLE